MELLKNILNNIINLDINNILSAIYFDRRTEKFILDLNKIDQLFDRGIDSNDRSLGGYAPFTIEEKRKKGLPTNRITLFDMGDFYDSFELDVEKDGFIIDANPIKEDSNLFDDFGVDILGLNEDSLEKLREYLIPLIIDKVFSEILQ